MANRAEEKARRREERLAREAEERKAAARKQRLAIAGGVVAGLAAAAVAVFALTGGGGDDGSNAAEDGRRTEPRAQVPIPPPEEGDYEDAAEAAGCELRHPPIEGQTHEERRFTAADYESNPPHSGNHFPTWPDDGIYDAGNTPELGPLVHTLEHGRINIQYRPGTPDRRIRQLETLYGEMADGYHLLLYENRTEMPFAVAATAWGHVLGCPEFNDGVFDAIRTFRERYIDKGPENVP